MSAAIIYSSDLATVYQGDALDVLPDLPTKSLDLLLLDPPYGVEWRSNRRAETFDQLLGDGVTDRDGIAEALTMALRRLRVNRHLYVFGPGDVLAGLPVGAPTELVWDKDHIGMGDLSKAWGPAHEPITFGVHVPSAANRARGDGKTAARLRKGSVLRFPRPNSRGVRHPSEKPVPLLRELIESSSRQGDTVLDPFAGSGSTGVAALLSGRRTVLVELDPRWAELAAERVRRAEAWIREAVGL